MSLLRLLKTGRQSKMRGMKLKSAEEKEENMTS